MNVEAASGKDLRETADRLICALGRDAPRLDEDGCSRFRMPGNVPVELFLLQFEETLFATAGLMAADTASAEVLRYAAQVNHLSPPGLDCVFLFPKGSQMICLATAFHIAGEEGPRFVGEFNMFAESVALVREKIAGLERPTEEACQPEWEKIS